MSKVLAILIPILFIAGILLYYFVFTGVITVSSKIPPGATVQIDGVVIGSTPIKQRVRTGVHQITVSKEGFETWQEEGKIMGTEPLNISVKLRFLLRSNPSEAKVMMNGKYLGDTELAIDLTPGYHDFEFRKSGYKTAKFKALIPEIPGEPIPIVNLNKAEEIPKHQAGWTAESPDQEGFGSIQISSVPDAQVYLDGELQGETPLTIDKIRVGGYVITLSREGYRDLRKTVYVKKGDTTKFAGELKAGGSE